MKRPNYYEIEIVNWEKYNPRSDIKKPVWFAFYNDFFMHDVLSNLSPQEVKIWLFILCERSRQQKRFIKVSEESVKRFCKVYAKFLHSLVKVLKSDGIVKIKTPCESAQLEGKPVRDPYATIQNNTEQYISPVVPLERGRRRKEILSEAEILKTHVISALRKFGTHEADSRNRMGEKAWKLIHEKYPNWLSFCKNYEREYQANRGGLFEKDLKSMFKAFLEEENGATKSGFKRIEAIPLQSPNQCERGSS